MQDPVEVEFIKAHAGLDIGDTAIGMHVKHVQVPIRPLLREIGHAHVTALASRPKLIGGARAHYPQDSIKKVSENREKQNKQLEKITKYSIRKLTVGVGPAAIGASFLVPVPFQ